MTPSPRTAPRPARILVVDDDSDNRELLEVILTSQGFAVVTASSGEEALASVAQDPPDLVLLDIMMPGMTGYQVLAEIKGNHATESIPIIMVTALGHRAAKVLAFSAGAADFLTKPIVRAELCDRVRTLLGLPS